MADPIVESGRRVIKGKVADVVSKAGKDLVVKNADLAKLIESKFAQIGKMKPGAAEALDVDVTIRVG